MYVSLLNTSPDNWRGRKVLGCVFCTMWVLVKAAIVSCAHKHNMQRPDADTHTVCTPSMHTHSVHPPACLHARTHCASKVVHAYAEHTPSICGAALKHTTNKHPTNSQSTLMHSACKIYPYDSQPQCACMCPCRVGSHSKAAVTWTFPSKPSHMDTVHLYVLPLLADIGAA